MHVDEALALVAAPTRALAFAAAKAVKPRDRAAARRVHDRRRARAAEQKLYGDDNVFKQFLIRKGHATDAELDAAFARAAQVIEGTYVHVAAGADVHRAAGDDGGVGRRALPHRRLDAVPVLRAQGDEAAARRATPTAS